jgi:hypothetical protein
MKFSLGSTLKNLISKPCVYIIYIYSARATGRLTGVRTGDLLSQMSKLEKSRYEPLLKDDLVCWRCGHVLKNMPALKAHLQEEWDKEATKERGRLERKRKHSDDPDAEQQGGSKKHEMGTLVEDDSNPPA